MPKTIITTIIIISLLLPTLCLAQEQEPLEIFYAKALVEDIKTRTIEETINETTSVVTKQEVSLKILNSKLADQQFTIDNEISNNPLDIDLKKGDKILVSIEEFSDKNYKIYITGYYRLNGILLLVGLFLLLLIILGGAQGAKTVISLILSIILIFKVLIPQTLAGNDPVLLALLISIAIAVITLIFIAGPNKKSLIAILGTLGGLVIAIVISYIFSKLTYLNGLSTEEARTLFYKFPEIDPQGVFFAGIIIAALGAVMDVAMSIASTLTEIKQNRPDIAFGKLFKSGINVGKDIMGTMSNTLIFAYVGVSLPLLLLYTEFGDNYINFINLDFITDEIVRSLGGSIGLITVIPITSLLAAFLYSRKK